MDDFFDSYSRLDYFHTIVLFPCQRIKYPRKMLIRNVCIVERLCAIFDYKLTKIHRRECVKKSAKVHVAYMHTYMHTDRAYATTMDL